MLDVFCRSIWDSSRQGQNASHNDSNYTNCWDMKKCGFPSDTISLGPQTFIWDKKIIAKVVLTAIGFRELE